MVNKYLLENQYKQNYECAQKFVNQNNLPEALEAYKRSLRSLVDLIDASSGSDRAKYKAETESFIKELAEKLKMELTND